MTHSSLDDFLRRASHVIGDGPVALILAEDQTGLDDTIRHHLKLGFAQVLVFAPQYVEIAADLAARIMRITYDTTGRNMAPKLINRMSAALTGRWLYYCYNAEYLFFPFCETRNVREMLTFVTEERRDTVMTYVVDLYAQDLGAHPDAVSTDDAFLDLSGYYALARNGEDGRPLQRQYDFFGGLRRRFEEHIPAGQHRIDRVSLFRAARGLKMNNDRTFSEPEYNTYACPWHNSLTAAICSFRTAKALKSNAGSTFDIPGFGWHGSGRFEWHSQQLMDLGLMEPGQWF